VDTRALREPCLHGVDGLHGRVEGLLHARGGPVLPVVWRLVVRDVEIFEFSWLDCARLRGRASARRCSDHFY
jgi:hypothetical protein